MLRARDRGPWETATLGGGCFWCLEAAFELLDGVEEVVPGYAGGHVAGPTYEQVCGGKTGHAEVVRVTYDPANIGFEELLEVFFAVHDPTTKDRQGADVGPQYRSVILAHDEEQRRTALAVIARLQDAGTWAAPVVTRVEPMGEFYPAEAYHRGYFRRNPANGYCAAVIAPKVAKLRRSFAHRLKPAP